MTDETLAPVGGLDGPRLDRKDGVVLALYRRSALLRRLALVGPSLFLIVGFMMIPIGLMFIYSFLQKASYGGVIWSPSIDSYVQFFFERDLDDSLIFNSAYLVSTFGWSRPPTTLAQIAGWRCGG